MFYTKSNSSSKIEMFFLTYYTKHSIAIRVFITFYTMIGSFFILNTQSDSIVITNSVGILIFIYLFSFIGAIFSTVDFIMKKIDN